MQSIALLHQIVTQIHPLSESAFAAFSDIWEPVSFDKKTVLTRNDSPENYLYFIVSGVQRIYSISDTGKDTTLVFTYAPSFGGVLDAFMLQQKSKYYYETLTHTEALRTTFEKVQQVYQNYPDILIMLNKGLANSLSGLLARMAELQSASSEEKFRNLLTRSPHILQLVPHKYLASYIGIDATNFSKFINTIKI